LVSNSRKNVVQADLSTEHIELDVVGIEGRGVHPVGEVSVALMFGIIASCEELFVTPGPASARGMLSRTRWRRTRSTTPRGAGPAISGLPGRPAAGRWRRTEPTGDG